MKIGYKLIAEAYSPQEMVRQAVRAEEAGFDFVEISDHFHPWFDSQGHSGFAWSMLAAAAMRTERIELATALLSEGRFIFSVGSGERLNEHVVGRGWPAVRTRHEMLRESLEIIRLLWSGGYHSYEGKHLRMEDARVFDLPETPPIIAVASGGLASARIAAELGDAIFVTEPRTDITEAYAEAGGDGPRYAEVPLSWAPDEAEAVRSAREMFRFGLTGWKVQSELPNPVNFEAATAFITEDDMRSVFGMGPEASAHLAVAQQFVDAGYDHLALVNAGPDPEGFFDFFASELAEPLRKLTPSS
jgi:G6PDH family F420-dependent oxidoreductase